MASRPPAGAATRVVGLAAATALIALVVSPIPAAGANLIGDEIVSMPDGGNVESFEFSPRNDRIVFTARPTPTSQPELYSVHIATRVVTKLNGPLAAGAYIDAFRIDSLGSRVVFLESLGSGGNLYSVDIGGGNAVKINPDGYRVYDFEITPNAERVVFTAALFDPPASPQVNLYSAGIRGGALWRLNDPLVAGGNVQQFALHPFGGGNAYVVYRADEDVDEVVELYSTTISPAASPIRLHDHLGGAGDRDVLGFWVAPAGQRIAYWADQDTDGVREVYSVLVGGTGNVKMNEDPPAGGSASFAGFDPAGTRIVYRTNDGAGVLNLYVNAVAGGSRIKLTDDVSRIVRVHATAHYVVYTADEDTPGTLEVFSAPIGGGTRLKISHDPVGFVAGLDEVSPDGGRVTYLSRANPFALAELWSVSIRGLDRVKLNTVGGEVRGGGSFSPNGKWVVWVRLATLTMADLWAAPARGGTPVALSGIETSDRQVQVFRISPNSKYVAYTSDQGLASGNVVRLYLSRLREPRGDFNADFQSDLVWRNTTTGENLIWLMDGTTFSEAAPLPGVPAPWTIETTADFDGNGSPDLVWRNPSTGDNSLWTTASPTVSGYMPLGHVPSVWDLATAGDFSQDGHPDLLWRNTVTGENVMWEMAGVAFSQTIPVSQVDDTNWVILGQGDFNADGQPDLVWRNTSTNQVLGWLMEGALFSSAINWGVVPGDWRFGATGDYNRDGHTDIVWRNDVTGSNLAWLMEGGTFQEVLVFSTVADGNWRITGP